MAANEEHAAKFDVEAAEIEFWFYANSRASESARGVTTSPTLVCCARSLRSPLPHTDCARALDRLRSPNREVNMIKLYTWTTPNGRKISIALEELGLDYEVVPIDIGAKEQFSDDFLATNPNHKIPAIDDDGLKVWESGAILLHLGERHDSSGRILPKDPAKRIEAIQYAFFQTGGVGPNLGRFGAAIRKEGEKNQEMIEIFGGEMDRLCGVIDRILADGDRDYLAGDYTIGDIMHFPWLRIAQNIGADWITQRPRVAEWLDRIAARPAVEKGMAVPA